MITLHGITWDHPRGYDPLVATADAYMSTHSDVRIDWRKRSLQDFADFPLERLAEQFDLLVIDHPFIGFAASHSILEPLDHHLSAELLGEQERESVGPSNAGYLFAGRKWALAIDAAAHVSVMREDLLQHYGRQAPTTWAEVAELADGLRGRSGPWVALPLIPVDTLMCFYTLCANAGEDPFLDDNRVVSPAVGRHVLGLLRALKESCHPESLTWNPPQLLDRMSTGDEIAYCPLLFGYSNYSRKGFRPKVLRFTNIPAADGNGPRGAVLGGAGLAISKGCAHPAAAADYCAYVASGPIQRGIYFDGGGQPGRRAAWTDGRVNDLSNNFFLGTLDSLDRAYLRPRFNGYMEIQGRAANLLHYWLRYGGSDDETLTALNAIYRDGLATGSN